MAVLIRTPPAFEQAPAAGVGRPGGPSPALETFATRTVGLVLCALIAGCGGVAGAGARPVPDPAEEAIGEPTPPSPASAVLRVRTCAPGSSSASAPTLPTIFGGELRVDILAGGEGSLPVLVTRCVAKARDWTAVFLSCATSTAESDVLQCEIDNVLEIGRPISCELVTDSGVVLERSIDLVSVEPRR